GLKMALRFLLDENQRGPLWRAVKRHNQQSAHYWMRLASAILQIYLLAFPIPTFFVGPSGRIAFSSPSINRPWRRIWPTTCEPGTARRPCQRVVGMAGSNRI